MRSRAFRAAFPLTLPVMAGYLVLGFGFGVLMSARGFAPLYSLVMSLSIYAGSMQYVAVDLLGRGEGLLFVGAMALLVNARHLFYGISMLGRFDRAGKKRPYLIFALTDETYSLLVRERAPAGVDEGWFMFFLSLLNQCYWVLGSLAGAAAGALLPFDFRGIEFSMTALFVVILTDQWLHARDHRPAVLGLVCSLLALLFFGPGQFILPAMGLILLSLGLLRGRLDSPGDSKA